jgi:hypothetical protein
VIDKQATPVQACAGQETEVSWTPRGRGFNSLVKTSTELAGANCPDGGIKVETGLDNGDGGGTARNAVLEPGEVDATSYVWNYANGAGGADGDPGPPGPASLTALQGTDCTVGDRPGAVQVEIDPDNRCGHHERPSRATSRSIFAAPGVGLEPTTYGSTVPAKSSRAVHARPPRPEMAVMDSTVVHGRPPTSTGSAVKLAVSRPAEARPLKGPGSASRIGQPTGV